VRIPAGDRAMEAMRPSCFQLEEEDNVHFAHNPLSFGFFPIKLKTTHVFANFGDLNLFQKL
jgi:hypothetical protein